ncbi:3-deoxy-manno-octulosonate cytidylyltransferase [Stieleria neptunia]|uniref:3-deoxy-manno-octulosonate cytidylyltransferase n=1 Tax=Stieleria neptunia TaxID=2527979 RepID=A0A518I0P5_9BACT|nr:3-deoxy-manno-octulosonate cytidylyltransferase [Stieleria neptunia]QDV46685.1 3-deoxy-manno-octulosonate cytidylyltransferase [Stieleria neptunia]
MPDTQIVLPARLASTRLPEKLLQQVAGKSVLQHTYESASRAASASAGVIVAVDDPRIADEVESFGGRWIMTPTDCPSGTDRIALVADRFPTTEIFINVQSDEPEIDPAAIDAVAETLAGDPQADMATAGTPIRSAEALRDPAIVKIVMAGFSPTAASSGQGSIGAGQGSISAGQGSISSGQGRAVYFSRACVPHRRGSDPAELLQANPPIYWHHLGLYAYRRDFLSWFAGSPPSVLEETEKLEQLRAIEAGKKIVVAAVGPAMPGIDTPEDLAAFRQRIEDPATSGFSSARYHPRP